MRIAKLVLLLLLASCAARNPRVTPPQRLECINPDKELATRWNALQEERTTNDCSAVVDGENLCNRLRRELEQLGFKCGSHAPTMMANAVLAYDAKQFPFAQQLLDNLLSNPGIHPEAATLRARLALEEGNLPFALRFLEQQIRLSPDSSDLEEVYAAALYLSKRWDESKANIAVAERLGSPRWRVAYHLGLVAEGEGNRDQALEYYQEALRLKPGWTQAEGRLKGLSAAR